MDQFLQDGSNKRTDAYGGPIENRARFMLEVTEALVSVWSGDRVGVRIGPSGTFNEMHDSNPEALFGYVAGQLNRFGLAYLHVIEPRVKGDVDKENAQNDAPRRLRLFAQDFHGADPRRGRLHARIGRGPFSNGATRTSWPLAGPSPPIPICPSGSNTISRSILMTAPRSGAGSERGYNDYPFYEGKGGELLCPRIADLTQPKRNPTMSKLTNKVALVTGASRGIGAAIAKRLAADGASVAITYSKGVDAAAQVVKAIEAAGGKALALQANASDAKAVRNAVEQTVATFGRLDILVNNAGTAIPKPFEEATQEELDHVIDLNLRGVFTATQAALKHIGGWRPHHHDRLVRGRTQPDPRPGRLRGHEGSRQDVRAKPGAGKWGSGASPSTMSSRAPSTPT